MEVTNRVKCWTLDNEKQQNNTISNVKLVDIRHFNDEGQNDLCVRLFDVQHSNDKVKMLQMLNIKLSELKKITFKNKVK